MAWNCERHEIWFRRDVWLQGSEEAQDFGRKGGFDKVYHFSRMVIKTSKYLKGASSLRQLCPRLCCWDDPTFGFFEKVDKLTEYLRYLVFLLFRIQRDLGWINLCLLRLLHVLALFQNLTDYGDCVHSREDGHYASCQGWLHHDIHLHASCVPGDQDQLKEYIGL